MGWTSRCLKDVCFTVSCLFLAKNGRRYRGICHVCQVEKTERKKEAGLLQPLPVPKWLWLSVSMDFIPGLPKVDGKASIMVIVDMISKYSVFIVAPELCSSEVAADLFYKYVVKYSSNK